ncbi:MAG: efflux RND transporter periplasmic adaptor subunit [Cyclobacteriaceae bacterium]|jgi:membrane fusion protein, multidrug efflux system|nr:efflux RND transporter periplasmic adaptor subunit [Cyclobacteriaceae bacterium]
MKKRLITIAVVVVVIFLIALPKLNLFKDDQPVTMPGQGGGGGQGGKLSVDALVIVPTLLDNKLNVTGSVLPNESLEIKSEVSGKITAILFREGNQVRKGDLLIQTDDDEIVAQLEKQKYNQKLNEDNEFRQRKLLEKDAISQEEYDNALNRLNTTVADIRLLQAQLSKTRIRAPFEGIIGLRFVSEGAYISPSTVIATLYNISPAKIEFAIPGRYSTQVTPGKKIRFTIESDLQLYEGEVYAIEPRIDPDTRTLKIRALADNKAGNLLPGQFVKVELILESIPNAILVPTEAVIPEQAGKKVYILENGKAKEVFIETGIRTANSLEVISGLKAGDTLLTTGILQLRQGLDVQIAKLD